VPGFLISRKSKATAAGHVGLGGHRHSSYNSVTGRGDLLGEISSDGSTFKLGDLVAGDVELAEDVHGFDETVLSPAPASRAGLVEGVKPPVK